MHSQYIIHIENTANLSMTGLSL